MCENGSPPGSVIAQRGFPCNASNPPGQNWPSCSFESWQQSGRDKGGLVTDPMFVDPERRDFRLQAVSPARAIGITGITPSVGPRPHTPMKLDDSDAWHESRRLPLDQAKVARPAWHLRPPAGILSLVGCAKKLATAWTDRRPSRRKAPIAPKSSSLSFLSL